MRNRFRFGGKALLFCCAILFAVPNPGHSVPGSPGFYPDDEDAISDLRESWLRELNEGDVEGVVALYSPGAVVFPEGGAPLVGAADITRWHERWYHDAEVAYDLETTEVRFGGNVVTEYWSARVTVEPQTVGVVSVGGDVFQYEQHGLRVYRRIGPGDWRIDRETWSAEPPGVREFTMPAAQVCNLFGC